MHYYQKCNEEKYEQFNRNIGNKNYHLMYDFRYSKEEMSTRIILKVGGFEILSLKITGNEHFLKFYFEHYFILVLSLNCIFILYRVNSC